MKGTCEKSKPPAKYDECLTGYEIVSALQNIEPTELTSRSTLRKKTLTYENLL